MQNQYKVLNKDSSWVKMLLRFPRGKRQLGKRQLGKRQLGKKRINDRRRVDKHKFPTKVSKTFFFGKIVLKRENDPR